MSELHINEKIFDAARKIYKEQHPDGKFECYVGEAVYGLKPVRVFMARMHPVLETFRNGYVTFLFNNEGELIHERFVS